MKNRGFTLVEVIISLAIMGIIMASVSTFFSSSLKIDKKINTTIENNNNIRNIETYITNDIRVTKEAISPDESSKFEGDEYKNINDKLSDEGLTPLILLKNINGNDKTIYAAKGKNLYRIIANVTKKDRYKYVPKISNMTDLNKQDNWGNSNWDNYSNDSYNNAKRYYTNIYDGLYNVADTNFSITTQEFYFGQIHDYKSLHNNLNYNSFTILMIYKYPYKDDVYKLVVKSSDESNYSFSYWWNYYTVGDQYFIITCSKNYYPLYEYNFKERVLGQSIDDINISSITEESGKQFVDTSIFSNGKKLHVRTSLMDYGGVGGEE